MFSKIIKLCYLVLFLFTPLIFTSFNSELFELPKMFFVYLLTTIILTLHLLNYISQKIPLFRRSFLDIPLILFLASQTISTFISVDPHTSIFGYYSRLNGGLLSIITYFILYWILVVYIDEKFKNNLINFSLISGLFVAIFGIAEHFGIDKNWWVQDVQNRVFSTLGQPNWLATYLCILLPFSISKSFEYFSQKKYLLSTIYHLSSTIFFICLLFTKSKSGLAAAIISLGIYFIIYFFQNKPFAPPLRGISPLRGSKDLHKGNLKQVGLVLIIISFIFLSLIINNPIKDRFFPKKSEIRDLRSDILITPSQDIRKIVWKGSFELWKKFPIFGTGVETFAYSYYWTRPVEHNLTSEWDFLYNKAHNEYLNYLSTTGTFGFLSYMSIIFIILFYLIRNLACRQAGLKLDIRNLAILSSIASILITNSAGFSVVITSLYFFLLPAFLINTNNIKHNPPKSKNLINTVFFSLTISFLFLLISQKILYYYLADVSYSQSENSDNKQDYEKAYRNIKISLSYNPNEPLYLTKLSSIASKLAVATKDPKYIDEAIKSSNQAINISPANTNFLKERAQTYYYLSSIDVKYFQEAVNSLLKVTQLAPTDAKTFYLIGKFLEATNLKEEAINYYQQAVDLKPNYDHAYFQLGQIYFEQKKYPEAKKNFESTLKYAPTNSDAKDFLEKIK